MSVVPHKIQSVVYRVESPQAVCTNGVNRQVMKSLVNPVI